MKLNRLNRNLLDIALGLSIASCTISTTGLGINSGLYLKDKADQASHDARIEAIQNENPYVGKPRVNLTHVYLTQSGEIGWDGGFLSCIDPISTVEVGLNGSFVYSTSVSPNEGSLDFDTLPSLAKTANLGDLLTVRVTNIEGKESESSTILNHYQPSLDTDL